ncbi:transcriptional regulator [Desulfocucumis palustris]|uniref:Transcriptional regulator n=1 Tax=Desulfocucumis palustris TaxID=1898651 RepID=A0A2L2XAK3_9FIRM|nr:TetR/AcrR family transcriptional regulator [Desulfocucumis palustris]GBF33225.1 transcriptional regulator [Desulfocucumis palustris]
MNGFEKRRKSKIEDILSAAYELFRKYGIDNVKITDIAKNAKVSKVSIYNFFGNKDELARQVIFSYMDKKAEEFIDYMKRDLSFKEKFELMYSKKMNSVDELTDGKTEGLADNDLLATPQVQLFLNQYAETKIKPIFIEFIEQGKREGEINNDIPTETILMYIQALHGLLSSSITMNQRIDLGKLYFYGFKGK